RLSFDSIANDGSHYVGTLPGVDGSVEVWVSSSKGTDNAWNPPGEFNIYAIGTDPDTGSKRAVAGFGTATTL
ncbi:hypothetical protein ACSLVN_28155, partial [Klebsiella pneumoniae]|uniref:hypothetical protein n=1 Tax=Klebsiella pneumoniae TaxID=573 RepID=UPI003EDF670A